MTAISDKCRKNNNTLFVFSNFLLKNVIFMRWEYMVEPDVTQTAM